MLTDFPAHGQTRASNELRKRETFISPSGIRGIWLKHKLSCFKDRLRALEKEREPEDSPRRIILFRRSYLDIPWQVAPQYPKGTSCRAQAYFRFTRPLYLRQAGMTFSILPGLFFLWCWRI